MNALHLNSRILAMGLGFLLLPACGCGDGRPRRVPVSGRVLIDEKPLKTGFLQVLPQGNRPASGEIAPDGRFTLTTFEDGDGCVPGKHPVAVLAGKSLSETEFQWFAPKKYADSKTSGLTLEVTESRDDIELHLTWQGSGHDRPYVEKQ
jgi:hypothetical protein